MLPTNRGIPRLLVAAAALIFPVYILLLWRFTVDDAYITLRYAQHLAAQGSLTYNPGDPPVEGYTTLLWTLLLTLPYSLRLDPVLFSKLLGLTATLASTALAARWVYELSDFLPGSSRMISAAFCVLCLAAFGPTAVHAVSGMETALFALLLLLFGYCAHRCALRPTRSIRAGVALAALFLGLTRPEGNLAALIGLATLAGVTSPRSPLLRSVLGFYLLPGAVYFIARWQYYGHLFPLPFYVKLGQEGLFAGRGEVLGFVDFLAAHLGILALFGLTRLGRSVAPILTASGALLLFFLVPEHLMGYDWRYLAPVAPVAFVLAALGLSVLQGWQNPEFSSPERWQASRATALVMSVCLLVPAGLILPARQSIRDRRRYALGMDSVYLPLGRYLEQAPRQPFARVVAMGDGGACPYYSGWRNIDLFGLNDPHIALRDPHDPARVAAQEYVMAQHPDVVVLISRDPTAFVGRPFEAALYRRCRAAGMAPTQILRNDEDRYLWVMAARGTPIDRYLRGWRRSARLAGPARMDL